MEDSRFDSNVDSNQDLLTFLARKERGNTWRTTIPLSTRNRRLYADQENSCFANHKNQTYPKNEATLTENHGVPGSSPGPATSIL